MALLQIAEPGQSAAPHQHKFAVGIDLGTTNSLVATVRSGEARCLVDDQDQSLLPSVVRFTDNGVEVGREAARMLAQDSANTIASIKRLMGRGEDAIAQFGDARAHEFIIPEDSQLPKIRT